MSMIYLDLQSVDFPAEVNDFFKVYTDEIEEIIDILRREDENWDKVANEELCRIANEYGRLDNDLMRIIGKKINEIAYGGF